MLISPSQYLMNVERFSTHKKINFAVLYSHQTYIAHQGTNYEFVFSFLYTLSVYDPEMIAANETQILFAEIAMRLKR